MGRPDVLLGVVLVAGAIVDRLILRLEEALDARARLRRWKALHKA